jgi:hypothetical protein
MSLLDLLLIMARRILATAVVAASLALAASSVLAQDTTINYRGQPPPTAMAPSIAAMGSDICAVPVSGAISSTVIGVAGGTTVTDANCERIKLARELSNQGLKVGAVAILCADIRVWEAMEMSGSPCPIGGAIGDAAREAWVKLHPERFKKLYGKVPTLAAADAGVK